jgi:hypothetical protein
MAIGNAVFEVFHTDVAKLDRDIAYVAIIVHLCCKCLFPVFYLFFRHMLHMFHTYVSSILSGRYVMFAIVLKCFSGVFASVSETCFKCFIYLLLYVASIVSECFKTRLGCCTWDVRRNREVARAVSHAWSGSAGEVRAAGPTAGALARKSDVAGPLARLLHGHRPRASASNRMFGR